MDLLPQLFSSSRSTSIPLVFRGDKKFSPTTGFPLWVNLIGPSGAGKDAVKEKLLHTGRFHLITTATNRLQRPNENENDYIWMRQRFEGEPEPAYLRALIREHNLIEYNYHYGNFYGTPLVSIKEALFSGKIALYCSENQGALFMEKVLTPLFNVLTIMIVPDSLEDMERRIRNGGRDNVEERIAESYNKLQHAQDDCHFIVKNSSTPGEDGRSGLESTVKAVKGILSYVYSSLRS